MKKSYVTQSLFEKQRIRKITTVPTNNNIINIHLILQKDARFTPRQFSQMTNIFVSRVHGVLKTNLKRKKINVLRIPNCLAMNNRELAFKNAKINFVFKIYCN